MLLAFMLLLGSVSSGSGCSPPQQKLAVAEPEKRDAPPASAVVPSEETDAAPESAEAAVFVVRQYYYAVNRRNLESAYAMWDDSGRASGQSLDDFRLGYADTVTVDVKLGAPLRIEPAAGSRYVEVPAEVHATTRSGEHQCFRGIYVLRRSEVDGATKEQRRWHLYSADLHRCDAP